LIEFGSDLFTTILTCYQVSTKMDVEKRMSIYRLFMPNPLFVLLLLALVIG